VECNLARLIVHTRSHLILDDLDLLRQFGARLRVGFSVPTDDDRVRKRLEPRAPPIAVRLKTMQRLRAAGIRVHAAVAPVLYCHPRRFAALLREAADGVYCDTMAYTEQNGPAGAPAGSGVLPESGVPGTGGRIAGVLAGSWSLSRGVITRAAAGLPRPWHVSWHVNRWLQAQCTANIRPLWYTFLLLNKRCSLP
jgi:hypothetical protein